MVKKQRKQMELARRWAEVYGKWQESGLKQRDYCQRECVSFWKFKAGIETAAQTGMIERRKRRRHENMREIEKITGFAAVEINAGQPIAAYCEIRFNGKSGIRIETAESLGFLRELLGMAT
jgi:hypothetical protein